MWPLYQYADPDPAPTGLVPSIGPRSKNAISVGCAASVQSNTEMPPWYHACTMMSRPGIGMSEPLWATQFSDRKSTRLNSSHANISYAVFCLKKKTKTTQVL